MNAADLKIEPLAPPHRGGQHVGLMPTGVKVTHVPTGLTASCDCERSQMRNKAVATSMIEWGLSEIGVKKA